MTAMIRPLAIAFALSGLAACAPTQDGLTGTSPRTAVATSAAVPGATRAEAVATVASRLKAGGFKVAGTDPARGIVRASASGAALVDCGLLTQTARGNRVTFPGQTSQAILFVPGTPDQIVRRDLAATADVTVTVGDAAPFSAAIAADYTVTTSQTRLKSVPQTVWRSSRTFALGQSVTFEDNITCAASDRIAKVLSGS